MITKPECLRRDCANDAYPLRSALRDKLSSLTFAFGYLRIAELSALSGVRPCAMDYSA